MNKLWDKLRHLVSEYQEILVWMPPLVVLTALAFHFFPQIDPRTGIDGLGQVFAMLLNVGGGIVVCFNSWLTKRAYTSVLSNGAQAMLDAALLDQSIPQSEKWAMLATRLIDLLEWILCFVFWSWVVFS